MKVAIIAASTIIVGLGAVAGYSAYQNNHISSDVRKLALVAYEAGTRGKMDEYVTQARLASKTRKDIEVVSLVSGILDAQRDSEKVTPRFKDCAGDPETNVREMGYAKTKAKADACGVEAKKSLDDIWNKMGKLETQFRTALDVPVDVRKLDDREK